MIILLLPLVVAILFCERAGVLYPDEGALYDSLCVHTFVLCSESKSTAKCERYEAQTFGGKVYVYVRRDSVMPLMHAGDTLIAATRIRHIDSIGHFDYRKYLLRQGIIGSAYVYRYEHRPAPSYSIPLQKKLYLRLADSGLTGDELATVGALTLGYKEDLDPTLTRRFQTSGAAHVLAVSGLHTGIIYALIIGLLTLGGRIRPYYENHWGRRLISLTVIAVMWGYAWLTGLTPSVVRAVVMVTLVEVGRMAYRQSVSLNTIASAAVLILLVRPLDLWSAGFQLSFAATTAIVLLAKECERLFHLKNLKSMSGKVYVAWLLGTVLISIAAQFGILPLTMYYYGYVSTYFLLTNLIVMPIVTLLVPCGLVSIALGGSAVGVWWTKITFGLSWLMNHSVGWIESLPGSTCPASVSGCMIVIYYILLLLFGFFMHSIIRPISYLPKLDRYWTEVGPRSDRD